MTRRLVAVLGLVFVGVVLIATPWLPPICPTRLLLHVPCPSCGLTRAARALLHGDLRAATRIHPLWWAVFPYLGGLFALEGVDYVRFGTTGRWTRRTFVQRGAVILLVLLIVVWVARGLGALGGPVRID